MKTNAIQHWFTYGLIFLWVVCCILNLGIDLTPRFANKGMAFPDSAPYRFITALLLHSNFFHMVINASALYFVGMYLEPQISPLKLLLFSFFTGFLTEAVFAYLYRNAVSVGGSPVVFALIGLICALQITKTDANVFRLGTWCGNWIVGYTILTNVPLFSDTVFSTLLIHGLSLTLGVLLGCLGIFLKIF